MQLVAPKTGADRERWLSSVYSMAPTPPALTGVPNQSFQGMDFQPAPGYQPQPQGFPLFGGLAATSSPYQSRIDTLQSRNDGLMGQMQDVRNQITGQLGQYQDMVSQPVQPFQMPQQHQVDPTSAKLGAVAAVLAILGGAHGQAANQAYGGFIQGQQQRADQETQRDTQQAVYDYQAGQQARQGKLQGVMAGVQKYENVLQGLGAEFNQGERQITSLVDQQERDKTRRDIADQAEAGRNDRLRQVNDTRKAIAAMKDPVAQAKAVDAAVVTAVSDPNSAFYQDREGALQFFGAEQLRKAAIAANQQSMAEDRAATRDARVAKLVSAKLVDEARAKEIVAKVAEMPARLADTLSYHAAQIERMRDMSAIGYAGLDLDQARILQKDLENDGKALDDAYYDNIKRIRQLNDYLNDPKNPGNAKDSKAQAEVDDLIKANEAISKYGTATLTEQKKIIRDALEKSKTRSPKAPAPQNGANGNLPASSLKAISGSKLRALPEVADAYDQMVAAAAKDGIRLTATDGYRTLAQQQDVKARKPNLAATPGKSQHGLGRALDINTEGGASAWLAKNAARFGFSQPPGLAKKEPWHWEYRG